MILKFLTKTDNLYHFKQYQNYLLAALFFLLLITSCKKGSGDGGDSTIKGFVHVTRYNSSFTVAQGSYYNADEWVYIIYGDDVSYGDRTLTTPDGYFEFNYLRKGNYTVYVYSEDASVAGQHAVSKTIEITSSGHSIDAGTLEIKKH